MRIIKGDQAIRLWGAAHPGMIDSDGTINYPYEPSIPSEGDDHTKPVQIMFNTYHKKKIYYPPLVPNGNYYVYTTDTKRDLYFGSTQLAFKFGTAMGEYVWEDTSSRETIPVVIPV